MFVYHTRTNIGLFLCAFVFLLLPLMSVRAKFRNWTPCKPVPSYAHNSAKQFSNDFPRGFTVPLRFARFGKVPRFMLHRLAQPLLYTLSVYLPLSLLYSTLVVFSVCMQYIWIQLRLDGSLCVCIYMRMVMRVRIGSVLWYSVIVWSSDEI